MLVSPVAHLQSLTSVPTKQQLATPYASRDTAQTNFFMPTTHLDTMGENNTPTALMGCGVKRGDYYLPVVSVVIAV